MPNSDFLNPLIHWLQQHGCEDFRVTLPKSTAAHNADLVLTGEGFSADLAKEITFLPMIAKAEYVAKARAMNIWFADELLFGAISTWRNEMAPSCCQLVAERDDKDWDNPFYVVQYAHHRAGNVAHDRLHWDSDVELARQLAVAVVLFQYRATDCDAPWPYMQRLVDFAQIYARWHESLLHCRAEKIRSASMGVVNGQIVQKTAIQHPISSALLARSAAITLQNGLRMLSIEPTKEWVE